MATSDLISEVHDGVGVITLNRPGRYNAFTEPMLVELGWVLKEWETEARVGAVILTGAGKAFCAGGDMRADDFPQSSESYVAAFRSIQQQTTGALYHYPKPVVAAAPGVIAGAGIGFALACQIRLGTPQTIFASGFTNMELPGDFGAIWLSNSILGPARTQEIFLLDGRLDATECHDYGIVHQIVEAEELMALAMSIAGRLAARSSKSMQGMLANLREARTLELADAMDREAPRQIASSLTEEHRAAAARFAARSAARSDRT